MRTSIESESLGSDVYSGQVIVEPEDEKALGADTGGLNRIAEMATAEGIAICPVADCALRALVGRTGDGTCYEIDIECKTDPSECTDGSLVPVAEALDTVIIEARELGVTERPIVDWSNVQTRPLAEAASYTE